MAALQAVVFYPSRCAVYVSPHPVTAFRVIQLPGSRSPVQISRSRTECSRRPDFRRRLSRASIGGAHAADDQTSETASADGHSFKEELLRATAGLDRGIAASPESAQEVEIKAAALERAGNPVGLSRDLERMQGLWKLVYSSGFLSGSLGGRRPGPEIGRTPIKLGEVFQRVQVAPAELDNIVTLDIVGPWPLPAIQLTATLAHSMETLGEDRVRIVFEKTYVKGEGNLKNWPQLNVPQLPGFLKPPSSVRSGEFRVTYLDEDTRITRGDRGELRVFLRA